MQLEQEMHLHQAVSKFNGLNSWDFAHLYENFYCLTAWIRYIHDQAQFDQHRNAFQKNYCYEGLKNTSSILNSRLAFAQYFQKISRILNFEKSPKILQNSKSCMNVVQNAQIQGNSEEMRVLGKSSDLFKILDSRLQFGKISCKIVHETDLSVG